MGFARTVVSTAVEVRANVRFLNLDGFYWPGPPNYDNSSFAGITCPTGSAWYTVISDWRSPNYPWVEIDAIVRAEVADSQGSSTGQARVGQVEGYIFGVPPAVWVGPTSAAFPFRSSLSPLDLWKMRDGSERPYGLANICHPLHLAMHYEWRSDAATRLTDASLVSRTWSGPFGPTDDIGSVAFTLGVSERPSFSKGSGDVIRIEDAEFWCGGERFPIDFSGYYESVPGAHVTGSGSSLTFTIDNWSQVPAGGVEWTAAIWWPVVIDYDLRGFDWRTDMPVEFHIASPNSSQNITVVAPYQERVIYLTRSWDPNSRRPFDIAPVVRREWAEDHGEMVDPPDLECTIEESGLSMAPGYDWPHFRVAHTQSLSVQLPPGCAEPPSRWETSSRYIGITQVGRSTEVRISPWAPGGTIRRDLVEDYFSDYLAPAGIQEFGLPGAYRNLRRREGSDIWNFENYQFLAIEYESDADADLTLTVHYSDVIVEDNHLTGQERIDGFSYTRAEGAIHFPIPVRVTDPGATSTFVIDLTSPAGRKLQHVDALEISGFEGRQAPAWLFVLRDLRLTAYNPTTQSVMGSTCAKVAFNRPDGEGQPISYTGVTCVTDGERCCRPPDQVKTRCGEEGLDFVERVIDAGSGQVLDFMRPLASWMTEWGRQEGFDVPDTGQARPGSGEYDSAFVDGDANDMLGGQLYAGDVCEVIEQPLGEMLTSLKVRPRVGILHVASGYPFPCPVRKILHGGAHGLARMGSARSGPGKAVDLYEIADGVARHIETMTTDDWSRFSSDRGCREAQAPPADYAAALSPNGPGAGVINTLWVWLSALITGGRIDAVRTTDTEVITVVYTQGTDIARQTSHDGGRSFTEQEIIVTNGAMPSVFAGPCDGDAFWVAFEREGSVMLRSPDGDTTTLLADHTRPVVFDYAEGEAGRMSLLAQRNGRLRHIPLVFDGTTYQAEPANAKEIGESHDSAADGFTGVRGHINVFLAAPDGSLRAFRSTDHGRTFAEWGDLTDIPGESFQPSVLDCFRGLIGRCGILYTHADHLWFTMLSSSSAGWYVDRPGRELDLGPVGPVGADLKDRVTGELLAIMLDDSGTLALRESEDHGRSFG